ncbi:MAG TPA: TfoX/Sxy family protein [Solirubrobacteraceae bacterium]|nr:TfoX/Sxy family protein [Solirubrobacteraceae bacterium]
MSYDDALAARVRAMAAERPDVAERAMFGGLAFMVGGNLACCVLGEDLLVRLAPEEAEAALGEPGVAPFGMPGRRPMRGFVRVDGAAVGADADLASWFDAAVAFAGALPGK